MDVATSRVRALCQALGPNIRTEGGARLGPRLSIAAVECAQHRQLCFKFIRTSFVIYLAESTDLRIFNKENTSPIYEDVYKNNIFSSRKAQNKKLLNLY